MTAMIPRPPAYKAPDRAAWEKKTGRAPIALPDVPASFVRRAALQVQKDWTRLSAEAAHKHQANLEAICEEVEAGCPAGAGDVYFDPNDQQFWLYPK